MRSGKYNSVCGAHQRAFINTDMNPKKREVRQDGG
jgi:hypothetical protein